MKPFLNDDFLLETPTARRLYHSYAKGLPIVDYHCHLSARDIWEDKFFSGITPLWLSADHYKWRLMRAFGVPEALITGDGDDFEKFLAYAKCLQFAVGNPLYHWSHLELWRYFGITEPLTEHNAAAVYRQINEALKTPDFSPRQLLLRSKVELVGTTDDPTDDLSYHEKLQKTPFRVRVVPSFRPDRVLAVEAEDFCEYIKQLSFVTGLPIATYQDLKAALSARMDAFAALGAVTADFGLSTLPQNKGEKADVVFASRLNGTIPHKNGAESYKTDLFLWLCGECAKRGWVAQWHMGAMRNVNSRRFSLLGADSGGDSMDDRPIAQKLGRLLDALDRENTLPKTILYSLNPKDNDTIATMAGNFQGEARGKIQLGAAWWQNDHKDGMEAQLRALANNGALATFVGMLTDSRSFLSFSRHEYFRRILCNLIGTWVEQGQFADDEALLKPIICGICYENARAYFNLENRKESQA